MPKTNWQDPGSSEVRSTHISGLQEAVGKIEDILNMQLQAETNVELSEVYISEQNRYRIFQAPEGKRNWASDPAPVIKKNGVPIASGFVIDYGGGAVIFSTPLSGTDTVTADFSRVKTEGSIIETLGGGKASARFVIGTSTSGWTEKDCDYLCDGTNDQEEIIQALNALPATGGEVVILDGTYNITASINIPKDNVSIRGSGNATTLKRMYNSTDTDSGPTARGLITLNEKSGCKIQGLQIDGNKATYTASYNYGIYLYLSSDNTVTGNTCNNNSYGIRLDSSSNENTVTGNTCNNNSYGIHLFLSSDNTVTGNTCNNNSTNGIYLSSSSNNNTITGNTCNNSNRGVYLNSSSNNAVTGNTCNNSNRGIFLSSSSNNNTITGNTCNNNDYGIYLYTSSNNNDVTGNTCNNNNTTGIILDSSSNNNTITGNICIRGAGQTGDYTSSQYTIRVYGTDSNYNLISSNNCMGKAVVISGGTGNSAWGNKFDNTDDLP
jgi:parallel beta-helix repeat protein